MTNLHDTPMVAIMGKGLPPWVGHTQDLSETERYRAMTPDERLAAFVEVSELARTILQERPDRREVLARAEPMPEKAERRWLELVAEARRVRSPR